MTSYRTPEPTGNTTTTPTPDILFPPPSDVVGRLRARLRSSEQQFAGVRGELAHARGQRDEARTELAAVRTVLAEALGGVAEIPAGSTTADVAAALVRDLFYARANAAKAHASRRVAEATIQRLVNPAGDGGRTTSPTPAENGCAHSG